MRHAILVGLAAAGLLTTGGCANVERSRDIGNPEVSATTLAQQVCSNCHGLKGSTVSPNFPNLAAQTEPYLVAQLTAFKSHGRRDPPGFEYMWGLSRSLSDEQIKGLAAYFAAQVPVPEPIQGDPSRFGAGKAIFETGVAAAGVPPCAGCHGSEGKGNASFPRIAGQHANYIVKQLIVFQRTEERTEERPGGPIMKVVAHELTRSNIDDVAAYVQAMPPL